jgi:hypothetical protein
MQEGEGNGEGEERQVGKWIGAMGFSQGTRVVGGLLRWMESVQHSDACSSYPHVDIQFGVLCMGSAKPMCYNNNTCSTTSSSRCSYIPLPLYFFSLSPFYIHPSNSQT